MTASPTHAQPTHDHGVPATTTRRQACNPGLQCGSEFPSPHGSHLIGGRAALAMPGALLQPAARSGWGGARPNSGGPRANSGGPRPGSGAKPRPPAEAPAFTPRAIQRSPPGPRWYVLQIATVSVKRIQQDLVEGEARPGFAPRAPFEVWFPTIASTVQRHGKAVVWHEPMLKGYLLTRFDRDADDWRAMFGVDGVLRLFMTPKLNPIPIKPGWVEKLMQTAVDREQPPKDVLPAYAPGDQLRVDDGPFTSFPGVCLACDGLVTRVAVSIFGRSTEVTMPRAHLSPL